MRARGSIPAWVKAILTIAGTVVVIALISSPIWRRNVDQCANVRANIEAVRTGVSAARISDSWVRHERREKMGWSRNVVVDERGDFGGYISQFTLRACLGSGWAEGRSESLQAAWVGEAWVYRKTDWPNVYYLMGIDGGVRSQIVITKRPL